MTTGELAHPSMQTCNDRGLAVKSARRMLNHLSANSCIALCPTRSDGVMARKDIFELLSAALFWLLYRGTTFQDLREMSGQSKTSLSVFGRVGSENEAKTIRVQQSGSQKIPPDLSSVAVVLSWRSSMSICNTVAMSPMPPRKP
jgi:hypothetical protein